MRRQGCWRTLTIALAILSVAAATAQAQWSAPIQCSNSPKIFSYWQFYDFDANGNIHICWRNWDDGIPDIYYANNTSGTWTQSKINNAKNNILVITPDQVIHYFWMNNDQIYEQTKPVSGGTWSSPVRVDANPSGGFIQDVIVDPSGGIYFSWGHLFDSSWTPPSGAYGRYKPLGGNWGPTEFIQGISNDVWPQNLQLQARDNKIYASYRLTNYSSGARYKVRENGAWSSEKLVTTNAYSCNLALSPTGEIACVYFNPDPTPESGTDWNVYAMFSGDGGITWGPEVVVRDYGDLQRHCLAVYDDHGNLHVAWEGRDTESSHFNLYLRSRIGCVWQPVEMIHPDTGITPKALHVYNNTLWCTYSAKPTGESNTQVFLKYKNLSNDWTSPGPVTQLTAIGGENRVTLSWRNPPDADFLATVVRASTTGYPSGPFKDREVCVKVGSPNAADSYVDYRLPSSTTYYYSVFAQDSSGNWSTVANAVATTSADYTPPGNASQFTATPYTSGDLLLQWRNPSDIDFKGTMIRCKTTGYPASRTDGILVCDRTAAPGSTDSFVHTGLTPGVTYYYKAFSYDQETPPNCSSGATTTGVPIQQTASYVKNLPDSSVVNLNGLVVTGIFSSDSCIYAEDANRAGGIRILNSGSGLALGDRINVSGVMSTRVVSGYPSERQISSATVTKTSSGAHLKPLAMACKSVGGATKGTLIPGVRNGSGANNMGSLVKIAGRVTKVIGSYIFVDDGSNVENVSGSGPEIGVMVRCSSTPAVSVGDVVSAVGIIEGSIPTGWTTNRSYLRLRDMSDLTVIYAAATTGIISGTITNLSGTGIVGATVSTTPGGYSTTTGSGGSYTIIGVAPGTYSVIASKSGYQSQTQNNVTVSAGRTTVVNFTLSPMPTEKLVNGNFEGGFADFWGGRIANGWQACYRDNGSQYSTEWLDYDWGLPQGMSQQVYVSQQGSGEAGIMQRVTGLTPGTNFTFSAYAYQTSTNSSCWIAVDPNGGTVLPSRTISFPNIAGQWNYQSINGTVGSSGAVTVFLWVWHQSNPPGMCWFDGASLMGL